MPSRFPQDFPPHLDPHADTLPVSGSTPLGHHTLRFDTMHWSQFEQFCWWLLQRDARIEGCQLIGGSGREQGGIDLFAYARDDPTRLTVFECKCWKGAAPAKLTQAVTRFLAGPWAVAGVRFVLILAQDSIGQFDRAWHAARAALHARGIAGELWCAVQLTEQVRHHPDILLRFFPSTTVTAYCNEWMRRVDFWTQLQKAMVDERATVREVAHRFVKQGPGEDSAGEAGIDRINASPGHWHISTPWVHIDALLPVTDRLTGSIAVVIRKPTTSGFTVALSQEWILTHLLARVGAPAEDTFRPFIQGSVSGRDGAEITIDLNIARLQVPPEGLDSLCAALDHLTPVYTDALRAMARNLGADGFPFIGRGDNTVVAMCSLPGWVWEQVLAFAEEHDRGTGESEWHIFDSNRHYLKVFTTRDHGDFDPGYHAMIRGHRNIDRLCYGDDVLLTWDPPGAFGNFPLGERQWMRCADALGWLRNKLLPAVGRWLAAGELRREWPWRRAAQHREIATFWGEQRFVSEHRQVALGSDGVCRRLGLVATVQRLQDNLGFGAPQLYLTLDEMRALYRAIDILLQGGHGYVPYIASNLSVRFACRSHRELIDEMRRRADSNDPAPPAYAVRCMLSAMLEALNDDDKWLAPEARDHVLAALQPLVIHHDLVELFERHSMWS